MKKWLCNKSKTALFLAFISPSVFANQAEQGPEKKKLKPVIVNTYGSAPGSEETFFSPLNKHSLGIGLGQTFLLGNFDGNGENGISVDAYYNYSASYSFDFVANLHYSKHSFKDRRVSLPGLALGIKGKFFQYDQFTPYAIAGLGFYKPSVTRLNDSVLQEAESKFTFGTNFGAGVDLRLNNHVAFGILLHYHNPFDVKQELGGPIEGSYSKLMITSMYTF